MMKMKRIVAWILCFCILAVFTACGAKQTLREDVKRACNIDKEGEKSISDMFKAFDAEFEKLRKSDAITITDLDQYAHTISLTFTSFYDNFHAPDWDSFEGEEKETAEPIREAFSSALASAMTLLLSLDAQEYGGRARADVAIAFVNEWSQFFYGTERISDEDLDQLMEKITLGQYLPFGLNFGDSYDEFSKKIQPSVFNVPQLENADSNNGYLTEPVFLSSIDIESCLGYSVGSERPIDSSQFSFSFNQNKELYEWYWFNETSNRGWDTVVDDMIQVYNEMFGFDGRVNDDPEVYAIWNTDTLQANIRRFQTSSGSDFAVLTFHCFEYDLNS